MIKKTCACCFMVKNIEYFGKDRKRKNKVDCYCKACRVIKAYEWVKANKYRSRYSKCKATAKIRNIPFSLKIDEYLELTKNKKCYYCDNGLPKYGGGLDRINNNKGYIKTNLVPCCSICNGMKKSLSISSFYKHISKIHTKRLKYD